MHLELLPVAALLRMDTELDALKREAGELSAKVERAKARVQAAEAEVQRVDADAKACAERQAGLDRNHQQVQRVLYRGWGWGTDLSQKLL